MSTNQQDNQLNLSSSSSSSSSNHKSPRNSIYQDLEQSPHHPISNHPRRSLGHEHSTLLKDLIINACFVLSWYLFATLISLYNKWMFSPDHYNFQFPLFVSSCHMYIQFVLASLTLAMFPSIRSKTKPTPHDYLKKALPCGLASGLDIGLSNTSLKTVTLSFYTMCKSSSLAFVLMFAFIFKLEKPTYKLTGIILLITAGVILMVSSETKFDFWGMVEVLSASCLGGLRWSLTQLLLDKKSMGMNTPIATIFWLAPTMGISLSVCSLLFEGWNNLLGQEAFFGDLVKSLTTMIYIMSAGVLAYLMTVSEYFLIQRTSVVTLSIAGIFKEVGTIFLSTVIFHDVMTPLNISGLAITLFGIVLYNLLKYQQNLKERSLTAEQEPQSSITLIDRQSKKGSQVYVKLNEDKLGHDDLDEDGNYHDQDDESAPDPYNDLDVGYHQSIEEHEHKSKYDSLGRPLGRRQAESNRSQLEKNREKESELWRTRDDYRSLDADREPLNNDHTTLWEPEDRPGSSSEGNESYEFIDRHPSPLHSSSIPR